MELYITPDFVKKDTRFKKGYTPWNKGRKCWTTSDPEKMGHIKESLDNGRRKAWKSRRIKSWNERSVCAYDLNGNFVRAYTSANAAAKDLGLCVANVYHALRCPAARSGSYQFRYAEIVEFRGEKLVKRTPIGKYVQRMKGWREREETQE